LGHDTSRIKAAIPRLNGFIRNCRKFKIPVFWTRQIYTKDKMHPNQQAKKLDQNGNIWTCREDHPEIEWYNKVETPIPGETIITKWAYDAFQDTDLHLQLQCRGIKSLLLTGFTSQCCVETTARRGYHLGYYIVAVADCIDSYRKTSHESALLNLKELFGEVAASQEIVEILEETGNGR
jgi:ureidoacrylate peracid hydrolase